MVCGHTFLLPTIWLFPTACNCRLEKISLNRNLSSPAHCSRSDSQRVSKSCTEATFKLLDAARFLLFLDFAAYVQSWQYLANNRISMHCLPYYQVEKVILYKDLMVFCNQTANQRKEEKNTLLCSLQECMMSKTPKLTKLHFAEGICVFVLKGR